RVFFFVAINLTGLSIHAATLTNPDFEAGALTGWDVQAGPLAVDVTTKETFNRNYAGRIHGTFASDGWITNSIWQTLPISERDTVEALGFVKWKTHQTTGPGATGYVRAVFADEGASSSTTWMSTNSWGLFQMYRSFVGVTDGGFESGHLSNWAVHTEGPLATVQSSIVDAGAYSLSITGKWTGWSWNEVAQYMSLQSGDVVHARARFMANWFQRSTLEGWAVAGIKLELGDSDFEDVVEACYMPRGWTNLAFDALITNSGVYTFRVMVCGSDTQVESDVFFDNLQFWKDGSSNYGTNVTVRLDYVGYSGGANYTNTVDVYLDSVALNGSSAGAQPATNIYTSLRAAAAATAADPSETDIPMIEYPALNTFGFPNGITNFMNFPAHVEASVAGWRFRYLTNNVVLTMTNTLITYGLPTNEFGQAPVGVIEFDQYQYCARNWGKERGAPLAIETNSPYFTLGVKDGSSAEFGEGPFPEEHTYVVGTSLTNFPRRMISAYDGRWPRRLNIVFQENLGEFDRAWDKYFVLSSLPTNHLGGGACDVKAAKLFLACSDAGHTNLAFNTQEIHLGWGDEASCHGMVDYPNCTYQDHNEVYLRAGWLYGLMDESGWFMSQVPRGSATIEPIDLYSWKSGNWTPKVYEECLFTWPNAISGVRSIFDSDATDRLPGPASYHVGYKIGHMFGTNEFGEPEYPGIIELRGNGYFRMTDYDGVMGGSFRPVSADIFGLYQFKEDAPIIPSAYTRLVARTTPTTQVDNSYAQLFMPVRSKTNFWFTGAMKVDMHATAGEVEAEGAYYELESDIYANRALIRAQHGTLNAFAQVDMYWRGGDKINDYEEGHDFDVVMVKKTDGEWVSHHPINPPTNIYHRSLAKFRNGDVMYIMQQDRAPNTYGFSTEAPYRKVSTFEFTMLDDGGRDLSIDVFEQNTISEINDNCVIACAMNEDLAKGEGVHCRYRTRGIYAPGVTILNPNEPGGGEHWGNNRYTIDFYATDGEDRPLQANLYYGNGKDDDWTLINTGELLMVSTNTHSMSYAWDVSSVPPGAYYIKATAQRVEGGKVGFDISNTRLQVGPTYGFPNNGSTNVTVVTNAFGYLGENMGFETGDVLGWASGADHLDLYATSTRSYEGLYAARMRGPGWTNWSWNNLQQQIPCTSGEVLHVTGRLFIGKLSRFGTNWIACGIKMEATNNNANAAGTEFRNTYTTGVWLNVDFLRTAPVTGTDRLLLWVAGNDCNGADVYFDDLRVTSTNTGTVVTNRVRAGYWDGDTPANVSAHDAISFRVASARGAQDLRVWVADSHGVTNSVPVTNGIEKIISLPRRADVPWSLFTGIDRTSIKAIGFVSPATNAFTVSELRSITTPFRVGARTSWAPLLDTEGVPLYNAGQTVTNALTIENRGGTAVTGLTLQVVQEYATNVMWVDTSPSVASRPSEKTRAGDRLCGAFEQRWSNVTIAAGGRVTVTNVYVVPWGRLIDHTKHAFKAREDWYVDRNYEARAQVHLVIRASNGKNLFDHEQVAAYGMDDNFDIDNDGLTDSWELEYGGSITGMDPYEDVDGDGYSNLEEFLAGSDPNDIASYPGHLTSYVVHLAYTNGTDQFPQAVAERSNYTGAACAWMIMRYLNGESFTQSQTRIYDSNSNAPAHNSEIMPESCARWMWTNVVPGYYFSARSRTNLADALKESVYWMDYVPPGGKKTPVYILSGTNWSYKVIRGFETDRKPYDGGFGVTTAGAFTIYGLWLNDPRLSGLGYDVFTVADDMPAVYPASETGSGSNRWWLIAEPPQDADELADAEDTMDASSVILASSEPNAVFAKYLPSLAGGAAATEESSTAGRIVQRSYTRPPGAGPELVGVLPLALLNEPGFMDAFNHAQATNYYVINPGDTARCYYLAAGELRGPGSTLYVIKLATNGALRQATWDADTALFPPLSLEAAEWAARQAMGGGGQSPNVLLNYGFETNTGPGGTPDRWTTAGCVRTELWAGRSGAYGLAFESWVGSTYGLIYQDYTGATGNTDYTFSIWMSKDSSFAVGVLVMKLEWFAQDGFQLGSTSYGSAVVTTNWQLFSVSSPSPTGTRRVRCTVWADNFSGSGALKCDDASLTAGLSPVLLEAKLVYDPAVDPSPFRPRWSLVFSVGGSVVTNQIEQNAFLDRDSDGDSMSDRIELYAGSDAGDPKSVFSADGGWAKGVSGVPERMIVSWPSATGRTYSIYRTGNLKSPFQLLEMHRAATAPVNTYEDINPPSPSYYRIEVE
ncbi:MAG: hypothetical protein BWK77_04210, partial [Verrucomicrobia bacterium A1]